MLGLLSFVDGPREVSFFSFQGGCANDYKDNSSNGVFMKRTDNLLFPLVDKLPSNTLTAQPRIS